MTTRRLAAILAADVAGFSALMERDEESTFARIGNLRREVIEPCLSEHQGRLIKTTGDGFLVEFASPIAALRCALAIQANLRNDADALRLRIGLILAMSSLKRAAMSTAKASTSPHDLKVSLSPAEY